jgi:hypothetical protein
MVGPLGSASKEQQILKNDLKKFLSISRKTVLLINLL